MKCNIINKNSRLIFISLILILSSFSLCFKDVKPPKANPYKEDKAVHHSLYREKDSVERMSSYAQHIPQPKLE